MTTNSTNDTNGDEYFSPEENREAFLDFATAEILKMKSDENYQSPYSNEAWEAIIEAEPMLLDFHKEGEIGNILEKLWLEVAAGGRSCHRRCRRHAPGISPGDAFVIPKGWAGTWDMKTHFKKIIVNF
jgi:hypothetical protein